MYLNKLSLNHKKSVFQALRNYGNSVPEICQVKINNFELARAYSCKYLGFIFDSRLKWHEHIKYVIKKTRYLIFIFAKLRKIITYKMLMTTYYGLFNSIATYGIISWGSAYPPTINPLLNIQKKILKLISTEHDKIPLSVTQNYSLNINLIIIIIYIKDIMI